MIFHRLGGPPSQELFFLFSNDGGMKRLKEQKILKSLLTLRVTRNSRITDLTINLFWIVNGQVVVAYLVPEQKRPIGRRLGKSQFIFLSRDSLGIQYWFWYLHLSSGLPLPTQTDKQVFSICTNTV